MMRDRLISLKAAIDAVENCEPGEELFVIKSLPSVTQKQRWIPCNETVDIPDHEILACNKYGQEMFGYLTYEDEQWLCASDNCVLYDPIAWREKPEPYREEGGDK